MRREVFICVAMFLIAVAAAVSENPEYTQDPNRQAPPEAATRPNPLAKLPSWPTVGVCGVVGLHGGAFAGRVDGDSAAVGQDMVTVEHAAGMKHFLDVGFRQALLEGFVTNKDVSDDQIVALVGGDCWPCHTTRFRKSHEVGCYHGFAWPCAAA